MMQTTSPLRQFISAHVSWLIPLVVSLVLGFASGAFGAGWRASRTITQIETLEQRDRDRDRAQEQFVRKDVLEPQISDLRSDLTEVKKGVKDANDKLFALLQVQTATRRTKGATISTPPLSPAHANLQPLGDTNEISQINH